MDKVKVVIGILLLIGAAYMWIEIDNSSEKMERSVNLCNQGWGDIMGSFGQNQCVKIQLVYYSPWILGFAGVVLLVKAGPYRGYQGYGGAGSRNAGFRLRRKTKKRLMIIIPIVIVVAVIVFLYTNYDITVADQRIDDIIPPGSFEDTLEDISKGIIENIPVEIKERP